MAEERQPDEVLRARKWLKTYERPLKHRTSWISTTDVMNSLSTSELSEMLAAFAQSIQAEARAQGWIKCSEKLPEKTGFYCVFPRDGLDGDSVSLDWSIRYFEANEHGNVMIGDKAAYGWVAKVKPTHWRELPAPPALEPK